MECICRILEHEDGLFSKKIKCIRHSQGFWIETFEERGAHENAMFYLPKKSFDQLNSLGKWSEILVWFTRWEELTRWTHPQILRPNWANLEWTSHLAIEVCELSYIFNYMCKEYLHGASMVKYTKNKIKNAPVY